MEVAINVWFIIWLLITFIISKDMQNVCFDAMKLFAIAAHCGRQKGSELNSRKPSPHPKSNFLFSETFIILNY